jgi:hypothetical protein
VGSSCFAVSKAGLAPGFVVCILSDHCLFPLRFERQKSPLKAPRSDVIGLVFFLLLKFAQLHPVVAPHVSHFRHVPFRTSVKLLHSEQASPV